MSLIQPWHTNEGDISWQIGQIFRWTTSVVGVVALVDDETLEDDLILVLGKEGWAILSW